MNRWMQMGGALTLALAVTACAGDREADDATVRDANSPVVGTSGEGAANVDREFVQEQMKMGHAEVELGQLAQQRAQHPEVKRFAEMMVQDHRMANQELQQALGTAAQPPTSGEEMRDEHAETLEEFRELQGREFDRRYMERMVEDHEKAVRDLENKSGNAENTQLRQWAAKTLPTVQQHLERAKTIRETLNSERER